MAAREHQEESFWPGYVDAIINVVLNILFMVALFTVALSTIDFSPPAAAKVETPTTDLNLEVKAPVEPAPSATLLISVPPKPFKTQLANQAEAGTPQAPEAPASVTWATRKTQDGTQLVTVTFDAAMVEIPPKQNLALSTLLRDVNGTATKGQWLIWVSSDTRQTTASRQAYMRVLSVRSALIDAGISPEFIQTRIVDVRESADEPSNRVQMALHTS